MNSGKAERDKAHREATRLASESRCLACHDPNPSEPAHYPFHRGMGGGRAGWKVNEWVPLCRWCHDALDLRHGSNCQCLKEQDDVVARIRLAYMMKHWP